MKILFEEIISLETKVFFLPLHLLIMVVVAQLVRASDCGSEGCGFETHQSPQKSTGIVSDSGFFMRGSFFPPGV